MPSPVVVPVPIQLPVPAEVPVIEVPVPEVAPVPYEGAIEQAPMCRQYCTLGDVCAGFGWQSNVDTMIQCNAGDQCFELSGADGPVGSRPALMGCMSSSETCELYRSTASALGVTVTNCRILGSSTGGICIEHAFA